jgi:hypothetical protein
MQCSGFNPTLLYSLQLILQTSYSCHANQIILSKTCIDTCEAISRAIGRLTNGLPRSMNKTKILVNRSALFQPAQMVWLEVILQVSKSYRYYLKGCSRKDPIKLSTPTKEISAIWKERGEKWFLIIVLSVIGHPKEVRLTFNFLRGEVWMFSETIQ